jgi:hypothetical protein
MLRLVGAAGGVMELERLRILDMYLLYPPLIHRLKMPQESRDALNDLDIPKASDVFVQLPSAAAVAQDLRIYQNTAIGLLVAKGLVTRDRLRDGLVQQSDGAPADDLLARVNERNDEQRPFINFLITEVASLPLTGSDSVYRRSALPSRTISL